MIHHSILCAYRNRPRQLRTFLESLDLPDGWELVIVDLGSTDTIAQYKNLRHLYVDYHGTFWKTKALNHALARTEAEWVTMVDVDCVVPRKFFHGVETFLAFHSVTKLSYRIYRIPYPLVRTLVFEPAPNWFNKFQTQIIDKPDRYPHRCYEDWDGHLTGNSHFTMRRNDLLSVGAWDERYIGYGYEDHDLNMRLWQKFGDTTMFPSPLFQVGHQHEANWMNPESDRTNRLLFEQAAAAGFPLIALPEDFNPRRLTSKVPSLPDCSPLSIDCRVLATE